MINSTKHRFIFSLLLIVSAFAALSLTAQTRTPSQAMVEPNPLTISLREVNVEDAVYIIAEHFSLTPEIHVPLTESVSLNLQNASLEDAMWQALSNNDNVTWETFNKRLVIFKPRETWWSLSEAGGRSPLPPGAHLQKTEKEPVDSKIVALSKRRASDFQKLLKDLNPSVSTVFDSPTNSVILMGPESQLEKAATLLTELDSMNVVETTATETALIEKVRFITEVFKLEHVDMEEVEKELDTIIKRDTSSSSSSSGSSKSKQLLDEDGQPIESEYFAIDRTRRLVLIHTSEDKFKIIAKFFESINQPLPQVLIETQIVAIDSGFEKDIGIRWTAKGSYKGPGNPWSTGGKQDAVAPADGILPGPQAFQYGKWNLSELEGVLNAAENNNKAQVLSRPRIMTLSGKPASIHVGSELPYTSSTTMSDGGNVSQNVEFKAVGIRLDVTPIVHTSNKTVRLELTPEVSSRIGEAINGAPIISTRKSEATVELQDGETMVIGGLISSDDDNVRGGVPILRELPILGHFFEFSKKIQRKTNLIILLTANIIDDEYRGESSQAALESIKLSTTGPSKDENQSSLTELDKDHPAQEETSNEPKLKSPTYLQQRTKEALDKLDKK